MTSSESYHKIIYEDVSEFDIECSNINNEVLNIEELEVHSGDTFTVQQAINLLGFGWFHVKLSLFVGLCWMADSMEITILSIIGPTMQCEWNITTLQKASMTTLVFLGMMISSAFWTQLSDRYGRKSALTLCGVLLVLYSLLSSMATSFTWFLVLRGLAGFAIGCIPQSVTLYAEFLPSRHKGKCVVLMDCFWAFGACFEIALALTVLPNLGWRWLLGLSTAPLLLFTSLTPWLMESARFYTLNGNNDKALRVLEQIAKDNNRHMLPGRLIANCETKTVVHIKTLLKPELRRITLILWFIWMTCAFCYYGLVLISAELTINDKFDPGVKKACTVFNTSNFMDLMWITFSEFPGIFATIAIIKRFGKKKTMCFQFLLFAFCVLLLTKNSSRTYNTSVLFIARAVISGLFQAAYMCTPEVYPNNIRSLGVGGCSTLARLGAMITPLISQVLFEMSHTQALAVYSILGFLSALACIILPENPEPS